MDDIQYLLNHILKVNSGTIYYTFSNTDGKTWLMPQHNMRTAMNLYQPAGIHGKLMKQIFPYVWWLKPLRNKLGITVNQYAFQNNLNELLCSVFHTQHLEFSIFCGTPSNHQKITIQISQGKNILGYCKISDREEIKHLFSHEAKLLDTLKAKGIKQIPECLYWDSLTENIEIFIQSTVKTNQSNVLHKWNSLHWDFLTDLKQKTEQVLLFEQTDFFKSINVLLQNQVYLSDQEKNIIVPAIDKVLKHYQGQTIHFSAYHGDFTPWNMFLEKDNLFVFDFEYAQLTYPPYLDWFHFFTQCCIFEKHLNASEIYNVYLIHKQEIANYLINPDFSYLCYLLSVLSLYLEREKGFYHNDVKNSLSIWLQLIYSFI
jgi:hypothetical protein